MNPLIAALLFLGVVAIGVIAYFVTYNSASSSATAQEATQSIQQIFSVMSQQFSTNPNTTGLSATTAANAGVFPTNWLTGSPGAYTAVNDPWGGAVTLAAGTVTTQYVLTLPNVPASVCTQLAAFYTPNTVSVTVTGGTGGTFTNPSYSAGGGGGGAAAASWPPNPAAVQAACSGASNFQIQWTQSLS